MFLNRWWISDSYAVMMVILMILMTFLEVCIEDLTNDIAIYAIIIMMMFSWGIVIMY